MNTKNIFFFFYHFVNFYTTKFYLWISSVWCHTLKFKILRLYNVMVTRLVTLIDLRTLFIAFGWEILFLNAFHQYSVNYLSNLKNKHCNRLKILQTKALHTVIVIEYSIKNQARTKFLQKISSDYDAVNFVYTE